MRLINCTLLEVNAPMPSRSKAILAGGEAPVDSDHDTLGLDEETLQLQIITRSLAKNIPDTHKMGLQTLL